MRTRTTHKILAAAVLGAAAAGTFALLNPNTQVGLRANTTAPTTMAQWQSRVVDAATRSAPTVASNRVTASAYDDQLTKLPAEKFADATSAEIVFGEGEDRSWSVFIGPAVDPPRADVCDRALRYVVLNCSAASDPATGDLTMHTVILTIKRPGIANADMYETRTDALAVARRDPSRVRFEQRVRLFRAGGSLSQVTETVYGTNDLNPASSFAITPSALTALAADPSLNVDLDD
ncbi:hypothetical protein GCM10023339_34560 [Alloalcanivorax gelatiniphagus]